MERLTERELNSVENVSYCKCFFKDCDGNCQSCELQYEADMKLKNYEDLEEQGLLLKLPCKVGDKIYVIENGYMYDFKINNIDVRKENGEYIFCLAFMDFKADDFGKIVFLSEEEAEAKIKELKNEV